MNALARILPRSLLGQVMLAVVAALLVAQAISAVLLATSARERQEQAVLNAMAFRYVAPPSLGRGGPMTREERRGRRQQRRERRRGGGPRSLYELSASSPVTASERRQSGAETELRTILGNQNITPHTLQVVRRKAGDDPYLRSDAPRLRRLRMDQRWEQQTLYVAALQRRPDAEWEIVRVIVPRAQAGAIGILLGQTVLLFVTLVTALYFLLRRITRPLAILTRRVEHFSHTRVAGLPQSPSGPADIRELIMAHNTMERRITAMLEEKDVMLGAIGHDLKTPLAALRVRIESVEDDTQRARMAASIEDITQTLDDILILARIGKVGPAGERTDIRALSQSVVEEFEDLGQPVTLDDSARIVAPAHTTWLKRAVRNLVTNAVRYGGHARVRLSQTDSAAEIRISDDGPGIPESRMEEMLQPFTRGEASRNKATGGAGLGLTLARAIAQQHGGELELSNRDGGGLDTVIRIPLRA